MYILCSINLQSSSSQETEMDGRLQAAKASSSCQQATPVQQEFLFVDTTQAKTSRQGRRNARSFVMQNARRERPWSTSKGAAHQRRIQIQLGSSSKTTYASDSAFILAAATADSPVAVGHHGHVTDVQTSYLALSQRALCPECQAVLCCPGQISCTECVQSRSSMPVANPDNWLFDPFQTSSVDVDENISELLAHFVAKMAPGIIAIDVHNRSTLMRSDWFGTAIAHSGFMHSLLCTVALHQYIFGRGNVARILHHRAQAIAAVNVAISSPDVNSGISDANIGAVFNLLAVEESLQLPHFEQAHLHEDQPKQRAIHMNGLSRMIQLRGGLIAIHTNRILQAFILWHAAAQAIFHFSVPTHVALDCINIINFPRHPPGHKQITTKHLIMDCQSLGVRRTLVILVELGLVLIADLNVWFSDSGSALDPLDVQNFACALECMLLNWLREHASSLTPLEDALCMALVIFIVRSTQAMKRQSDVHLLHCAASQRLKRALDCTSCTYWMNCPYLFLWILCIGAISADGSNQCSWFVQQASLACEACSIHSAQALLGRLHCYGWVTYKLNDSIHFLWNRIINLRIKPHFTVLSEVECADSHTTVFSYHICKDSNLV